MSVSKGISFLTSSPNIVSLDTLLAEVEQKRVRACNCLNDLLVTVSNYLGVEVIGNVFEVKNGSLRGVLASAKTIDGVLD